ncbi:DUF4880 domain-containing protein [Pseudomonas entomophila]|uniref:DUF4880 domain-containing protein n=1 Tax=Pseudomonas entomophila TaxID=312306 RepID=UPI0023D8A845|nr:DUF4880 domain-containing protein [Pseudomonas entomophila]MDF0729286.1 DUF4880 domain-containing protein [Pseudomonas entomophila]
MSEQALVEAAAQWMARLHSGQVSEAEAKAFQQWHDSHPRHAQVFQRMSHGLGQAKRPGLQGLSDTQVIDALRAPHSRRAFLKGSLGALAAVGIVGVGLKVIDAQVWAPGDLLTLTGQRRTFELEGGNRLTLNAQTRVSPGRQALYLHQGAVQLECVGAPVVLATSQAQVETGQGGRLLLERRGEGEARLTVLASQARLRGEAGDGVLVKAGQQAWIKPPQAPSVGRADPAATAWLSGLLQAHERPLGEVLEALRAYHHGVLRVSPAAARLRVSGVFTLDDSARALRLIAATLPVRVVSYGGVWVSIEAV